MWKSLGESGITGTSLRGVAQLLETKAGIWGRDSREFGHLIEATLIDAGLWRQKGRDAVTPDDVTSGRFANCLELYLHILKAPLSQDQEKKSEQQPAAV